MDNFDISNVPGNANLNKPIPLNEDLDKPIPFDDGTNKASVSHSPLSLGGSGAATTPQPAMPEIEAPKPAPQKVEEKKVSSNRISGVKTFFTKLHPGAIEFLDEQITEWLKENPGITIKHTNTVTGDIQAKKTEPNIIITVWY
jgi:ABC-type glycerol-3-phosphate transport system substrate-binding protein